MDASLDLATCSRTLRVRSRRVRASAENWRSTSGRRRRRQPDCRRQSAADSGRAPSTSPPCLDGPCSTSSCISRRPRSSQQQHLRQPRRLKTSVAEWLVCWTQAQKGLGSNRSRDAVGQQSWANCSHPSCLCSPSREIGSSPLKGCDDNCGPGGK